jgi:hypothetical protein
MLVPKHILPKAIAVNSMAFQTGLIAGPALGGVLVGFSPKFAYAFCAVLTLVAAIMIFTIRAPTAPDAPSGSKTQMLREGMKYVWEKKIVFGAISLDLFAVLLGGATALMPVFARDIIHPDTWLPPQVAFGILRASPAIGALGMSLYLSLKPLRRNAGPWMFAGVAIFGLSTIVFGLSTNVWISILAIIVLGAADMISVYVRGTLIQIVTPDHMRGRVASVSYLFIGASNELGEFETGVMTRIMGPVTAALYGSNSSLIYGRPTAWNREIPCPERKKILGQRWGFSQRMPRVDDKAGLSGIRSFLRMRLGSVWAMRDAFCTSGRLVAFSPS